MKVHYIGYSTRYDEWKDASEVEDITPSNTTTTTTATRSTEQPPTVVYRPYSFYENLRVQIKQSMICSRKRSPNIKIRMPIDVMMFNGGLKMAGYPENRVRGVQCYKIEHYRDLDSLLGKNWHFRGLNDGGDYGYVILSSVLFYIKKGRLLTEHVPTCSDNGITISKLEIDTGHYLHFNFTEGYGNSTTFGKSRDIFDC